MIYAYISSPSWEVLAQLSSLQSLEVKRRLSDISTASFRLSQLRDNGEVNDLIASNILRVWNRIEITTTVGSEEKTLIDGVIRSVKSDLSEVSVEVADRLEVLRARILWADTTFTNVSIASLLSSILATTEARLTTGITLSCSETSLVTKTFNAGTSIFDALKSLVDGGVKFRYSWGILEVGKTLGSDLSTGASPVAFSYDVRSPYERDMSSVEILRNAETVGNSVLIKNSSGALTTAEDTSTRSQFGLVERFISSKETSGTTIAEASAYLDDHSQGSVEVSATPITTDFFAGEVGDTVGVFVYGACELSRYDGTALISEKTFTNGTLPIVSYALATETVKTLGFFERIRDLGDRLRLIERRS